MILMLLSICVFHNGCTTSTSELSRPKGNLIKQVKQGEYTISTFQTDDYDFATEQIVVGEYTIRTFRPDDGDASWNVSNNGRVLIGGHGFCFSIAGMEHYKDCFPADLTGKDINGDGKPDIVIFEWTGGAHSSFVARVIELDGDCRLLAEINGIDSVPEFKNVDQDGVLEIVLLDMTYRYWPGCFATSPAPTVILRWNGKKYVPDARLMATPPPNDAELKAKALKISQDEEWDQSGKYRQGDIPQDLFQTALDLMYGGYEEKGWEFIKMAWTPHYPVDNDVLEQLRLLMGRSPYWKEVVQQRSSIKNTIK
jgi:hypothetical protein